MVLTAFQTFPRLDLWKVELAKLQPFGFSSFQNSNSPMKTHPKNQNDTHAATCSLMQDANRNPIQYCVMSPDGISITPEPFASLEAAARYIPKWFEMFRHQGYYAAVGRRIPLDEVVYHLNFVPVWPDDDSVEWPSQPF